MASQLRRRAYLCADPDLRDYVRKFLVLSAQYRRRARSSNRMDRDDRDELLQCAASADATADEVLRRGAPIGCGPRATSDTATPAHDLTP